MNRRRRDHAAAEAVLRSTLPPAPHHQSSGMPWTVRRTCGSVLEPAIPIAKARQPPSLDRRAIASDVTPVLKRVPIALSGRPSKPLRASDTYRSSLQATGTLSRAGYGFGSVWLGACSTQPTPASRCRR
jgi:hypothetical protein